VVEQPLALGTEVTQMVGLEPVCQNAKQQMAGQVRGRPPPEHGVPTRPKCTNIEIAQARDLDVD
jgi:hypothetical protein